MRSVIAGVEIDQLVWVKSSVSPNPDTCVEVAQVPGGVALRDSTDPAGPVLGFTHEEWAAFTAGVRGGEFSF
jgi:hypothetical protein